MTLKFSPRMNEPDNLYARVLHQAAQRRADQRSIFAAQMTRIEAKNNGKHAQEQRQASVREGGDPIRRGWEAERLAG